MKPDSVNFRVNSREVSRRLADVSHAITSCERCPRLREHCRTVAHVRKRAFRDEVYWGRPVPGFGDPAARLLLVGLAPAAHGANRTGRVFTGDGVGGSGDFLMSALHRTGFASIPTSQRIDDGLQLRDAYILAAVRCAPPQNKPSPEEIARCQASSGRRGRRAARRARGGGAREDRLRRVAAAAQATGDMRCRLDRSSRTDPSRASPARPTLVGCYHPSRQNTNTGKLTPRMMERRVQDRRRRLTLASMVR